MTDESPERVLRRYRSTALEEPCASLDCAILALARRKAARVRSLRRGAALCAMLTVAAVLASPSQRPGAIKTDATRVRTNYGLQAGSTRYYLLTVSVVPPGAIDWR